MNLNAVPTKGNLIIAKNSLALSKRGYSLMDRKRNILIRELMGLISSAGEIQKSIDSTYKEAYQALQKANIEMGIYEVRGIGEEFEIDQSIQLKTRSIMGVEIPLVEGGNFESEVCYSLYNTKESFDIAIRKFQKVKELTLKLATVEISAYRLAEAIKKTQKRANALKNITIPRYTELTKNISNALEEKEREEFTRLKVIKARKEK